MNRRITRVSVLQTSLTMSVMYAAMVFLIGIILAILGTPVVAVIGSLFGEQDTAITGWLIFSVGFATFGAVVYGIFGYVFTALIAFIYNIVSNWTGGVELTLSE